MEVVHLNSNETAAYMIKSLRNMPAVIDTCKQLLKTLPTAPNKSAYAHFITDNVGDKLASGNVDSCGYWTFVLFATTSNPKTVYFVWTDLKHGAHSERIKLFNKLIKTSTVQYGAPFYVCAESNVLFGYEHHKQISICDIDPKYNNIPVRYAELCWNSGTIGKSFTIEEYVAKINPQHLNLISKCFVIHGAPAVEIACSDTQKLIDHPNIAKWVKITENKEDNAMYVFYVDKKDVVSVAYLMKVESARLWNSYKVHHIYTNPEHRLKGYAANLLEILNVQYNIHLIFVIPKNLSKDTDISALKKLCTRAGLVTYKPMVYTSGEPND